MSHCDSLTRRKSCITIVHPIAIEKEAAVTTLDMIIMIDVVIIIIDTTIMIDIIMITQGIHLAGTSRKLV